MAGTVVVDAVKSSTTGAPTFQNTSGTEIGTLCRAWVNWNGVGGATVRGSFNVSSVVRNGTADYTVNFTNAMPDGNYAVAATGCEGTTATRELHLSETYPPTASYVRLLSNAYDLPQLACAVFR